MALDKQKILNELGSVVNQLQSADCGCMGKLFSNSTQANSTPNSRPSEFSGGMTSCCGHHSHHGHHGYNAPCAGEPYTGARHCMGLCNPPKLYADTYNYLNKNMMQPVVQEVYDDLKSINPANTVMNNPLAGQMGLSHVNNPNQGNMLQNAMVAPSSGGHNLHTHTYDPHIHFGSALLHPGQQEIYDSNSHQGMGQISSEMSYPGHGTSQMSQENGQVGLSNGQIGHGMNQMVQGMNSVGQGTGRMGQAMGQMAPGMGQTSELMRGMGPQIVNMMSSTARNNSSQNRVNPDKNFALSSEMGQTIPQMTRDPNMGQHDPGQLQNNAAYMEVNNNIPENNLPHIQQPMASGEVIGNIQQQAQQQQSMGNMNINPRQKNNPNPYGQHSAGIAKFNEMFPGVMRSDLGFDPMAIAIQMNPANQQRSAMDTMQKMMTNNSGVMERIMDSPQMQPVVNATNAVSASLAQPKEQLSGQVTDQLNIQQEKPGEIPATSTIQSNQTPQQVYSAITGTPTMNRQQIRNNQYLQQPSGQVQQRTELNSLPTVYEGSEELVSTRQQSPAQVSPSMTMSQHYKEPIFPADTSRHLLQSHHFKPRKYDYNTLGQPVQMVSAVDYQALIPELPQTMSGQVVQQRSKDPMAFSNIKATVSKTAIVGNRPMGKIPSRSQLHHEYNQYKGSQSFTQNIQPSGYTGSHSEGRINIPHGNAPRQQYIEKVGGDTAMNDQLRATNTKMEPNVGEIGDMLAAKKQPDVLGMVRATNNKTRNGLQDQVYSSYPTSTKWSFHGTTPAPYSVGYRFKSK